MGGWFTWSQGEHRWYVLDSCSGETCQAVEPKAWQFSVFRVRDGAPFEVRTTSSTLVGQMKLRLTGCRTGIVDVDVQDEGLVAEKTLTAVNLTPYACE